MTEIKLTPEQVRDAALDIMRDRLQVAISEAHEEVAAIKHLIPTSADVVIAVGWASDSYLNPLSIKFRAVWSAWRAYEETRNSMNKSLGITKG